MSAYKTSIPKTSCGILDGIFQAIYICVPAGNIAHMNVTIRLQAKYVPQEVLLENRTLQSPPWHGMRYSHVRAQSIKRLDSNREAAYADHTTMCIFWPTKYIYLFIVTADRSTENHSFLVHFIASEKKKEKKYNYHRSIWNKQRFSFY